MKLLDLLYPPTCLHCNEALPSPTHLCENCLENLTLLFEEGHCRKCFSEIATEKGVCKACRKISHPFFKCGACFEAFGPAMSLQWAFIKQKQIHLAKDIAAYFVIQIHRLHWPLPQDIVPLPDFFHTPSALVAKEMALMLECSYSPVLRRHFALEPIFSLKKKCKLSNKTVLLISADMQNFAIMHKAGWTLDKGQPLQIYGMRFCAPY